MKQPIKVKKLLPGRKVPVLFSKMRAGVIIVEVDRRNRAGALVYPYIYQLEPEQVRDCQWIVRPGGWPAYAVPLRYFRKVAKRGEFCIAGRP